MKKFFLIFIISLMFLQVGFAQSTKSLEKEYAEQQAQEKKQTEKNRKEAKKEAKRLMAEGWTVSPGEESIEEQIFKSLELKYANTWDESGNRIKRYIQQNGMTLSGSYNAGYAAARMVAQNEIATMLSVQIVSAMQSSIDNSQQSASGSMTEDEYKQRTKATASACLTNFIPVAAMYRRVANNNLEVSVRIAYDKFELVKRLKRGLQKNLNLGDDVVNGLLTEIIAKD